MTIEQLLGYDGAQLKAMTDAELLVLFEPVLKTTRPEFAEKPQPKAMSQSSRVKAVQDETMQLMKQLGIKLPS